MRNPLMKDETSHANHRLARYQGFNRFISTAFTVMGMSLVLMIAALFSGKGHDGYLYIYLGIDLASCVVLFIIHRAIVLPRLHRYQAQLAPEDDEPEPREKYRWHLA